MKTFQNFEEMRNAAFKINDSGELCSWPQFACQKRFIPSVENNEKKYNVLNDVVTFVFEGHQYVIPFTDNVYQLLFYKSFSLDEDLQVPFAHHDYPIERMEEWKKILTQ